ncbi:MAG: tetratricopeptide repeat protein, partial [Helicobacteraceae bacterium]|nr:tetratricopeptide repeat protein [Helicobacteraceae bacterium]
MPNYNQPNVSEILDRAKAALGNENYQEAIRLYGEALKLDPND